MIIYRTIRDKIILTVPNSTVESEELFSEYCEKFLCPDSLDLRKPFSRYTQNVILGLLNWLRHKIKEVPGEELRFAIIPYNNHCWVDYGLTIAYHPTLSDSECFANRMNSVTLNALRIG